MPSYAFRRELAGLRGLLGRASGALTMPSIFNQGQSGSLLDKSLRSIPSTSKTDAGRALGNTLGNELRYMGSQLQRGSLPYLGNEMRYATNELSQGRNPYGRPLNAIDYGKYGPTDWNPSANPSRVPPAPSGGAADRAYQRELSRTAQLTAQDPELQRYEKARAGAKSQEEMNSVRDMGLAMWQEKYGKTAMGNPGGAIGSTNPLMDRTFGYQTGMSGGIGEYTMGPSPLVPQVDPALNPAGPTYAFGEGPRLMNFSNEDVTPEMIKAHQEQLLKQAGAK